MPTTCTSRKRNRPECLLACGSGGRGRAGTHDRPDFGYGARLLPTLHADYLEDKRDRRFRFRFRFRDEQISGDEQGISPHVIRRSKEGRCEMRFPSPMIGGTIEGVCIAYLGNRP